MESAEWGHSSWSLNVGDQIADSQFLRKMSAKVNEEFLDLNCHLPYTREPYAENFNRIFHYVNAPILEFMRGFLENRLASLCEITNFEHKNESPSEF